MAVTVRQKRKGPGNSWHVFLHQGGKITSKAYPTKREANRQAAKLRSDLRKGAMPATRSTPPSCTFGEQAKAFLKDNEPVLKATTLDGYRKLYALHLKPTLAGRPINRITRDDVKALLAKKRTQPSRRNRLMSVSSLKNIRNLISGIFRQAVEAGIIDHNPAQRLGRFIGRGPDRRNHMRVLTAKQVAAVLAMAKKAYPDYYAILLCAFQTGMRLGEFVGLGWEDIDFAQKTITVRRGWTHGAFTSPKTHRSRSIAMSDVLADELTRHRSRLMRKFGGKLPTVRVPEGLADADRIHLAFPYFTGYLIDPSWFRQKVWWLVLEKAGLPRIRIHDIRHTVASLLLQKGFAPQIVMKQLGHSSIMTTVDIYGHLTPDDTRDAVNALSFAAG